MKKIILSLIASTLLASSVYATTSHIVSKENGHGYNVMKVVLDGNSKVVVSVVDSGSPAQSLRTLMNNVGGSYAINGGFFCPNEAAYSRCTGNTTDLVRKSDGVLYSKRKKDIGTHKSVFGFEANGMPEFVSDNGSYAEDTGIDNIFNGIGMPTLVKDGVNVAVLNDAMNNDPKQGKAGNKTFIWSTSDDTTIYMGYVDGVTFSSLADYIIATFKCDNAIQLDNGWSKAMIADDAYVVGPGRNIMDAFVIIEGEGVGPVATQELQNAITRMYSEWLTKYSTIQKFLPYNTMTREEAAKFFSVFAQTQFDKQEDAMAACQFADIATADLTLKNNITLACKLGIFKWYNGNFLPKDTLNNWQAITVLMRIMVGMMTEPASAFYANYLAKAQQMWLVDSMNTEAFITRWEAALLLYKAHLYNDQN